MGLIAMGDSPSSADEFIEGAELEHGLLSAQFRLAGDLPTEPVEVLFRASDEGNRYFVRATGEG